MDPDSQSSWIRIQYGSGSTTLILPGVKLVDDALEPDDRKQSGTEASQPGQRQDKKDYEALGANRVQHDRGPGHRLHGSGF